MHLVKRALAGAEAGLLAGAGVAAFFFIQDAVHLQPLATPIALASGLLGAGASTPDGDLLSRAVAFGLLGAGVLAYTALHFLVFAAGGVAGAFLIQATSFWRSLVSGVAFGSVLYTGLFYGSRWLAGTQVSLDVLGLPSILLVNAMGGALLGLGMHLAQSDVAEEEASPTG